MPEPEQFDVVVVGAGPVGVTAANLLGLYGVRTLALERDPDGTTYPRVASVDEEALRVFQLIGLADEMLPEMLIVRPALQLLSRRGRVLVQMDRASEPYGFPAAVTILQQVVETQLRAGLARYPTVTLRAGHAIEDVMQDDAGVTVGVRPIGAAPYTVRARYVLACDGGRSTVRQLCGVALVGDTAPEEWLIVDTRDPSGQVRSIRMFGNAARAIACIPLPGGYLRWELRLLPGERAEAMEQLDRPALEALIAAVTGGVSLGEIERRRVYKHHSRMAERFQIDRILLLGDAAHLMPPFAGQGLCSGLRDAANACWKVAAVLEGRASPAVLASYELERRPHAAATVASSSRLGATLFPRSRFGEWIRDIIVRVMMMLPPSRRFLTEGRAVKPIPMTSRGLFMGGNPAGGLFVQPRVTLDDGRSVRLDEVLGSGFALIGLGHDPTPPPGTDERAFWDQLQTRYMTIAAATPPATGVPDGQRVDDTSGELTKWFRTHGGTLAVVRPDRYVAGLFQTGESALAADALRRLLADGA